MEFNNIKSESLREAYEAYEKVANEFKNKVIDLIATEMAERFGDYECYLEGKEDFVLVENEYDANLNVIAEVIYFDKENNEWVVEGDNVRIPLKSLSVDRLVYLYHCFEQTIDAIFNED